MFEWDESKNQHNLEKHGIAFEDVLSVFGNREALALEDKRRDYGEPRYVVLCPLQDVLIHVTYTVRGGRHQADLGPAREQTREAGL
jgi:uncharacterized protein